MAPSEILGPTSSRRSIRSYILHKGRITRAQSRALQEHWAEFGIETQNCLLDLDAIFERQASKVLEIGFGNGEVLAAMAEADPDTDFIGVEVYQSGIGALLNRIKAKALTNIRIIQTDAAIAVPQCIADHCLNKIMILFPDPWPKKRHHKRRLVQKSFVNMLADKLCDGGVLHLATDWKDYATAMHDAVIESGRYKELNAPLSRPATAFERRGRAIEHDIYDLYYELIKGDSFI